MYNCISIFMCVVNLLKVRDKRNSKERDERDAEPVRGSRVEGG